MMSQTYHIGVFKMQGKQVENGFFLQKVGSLCTIFGWTDKGFQGLGMNLWRDFLGEEDPPCVPGR
jgi:hypothetical protein